MSTENDTETATQTPCPRCDGCGQLANSDDREPWSDWLALPLQSALAVTTGLVKPEPCDECGGTGKAASRPASEHDTDPILEAALVAAGNTLLAGDRVAQLRAALEVVAPHTRRIVAEEIAVAIEHNLGSTITKLASIAREIGGTA